MFGDLSLHTSLLQWSRLDQSRETQNIVPCRNIQWTCGEIELNVNHLYNVMELISY